MIGNRWIESTIEDFRKKREELGLEGYKEWIRIRRENAANEPPAPTAQPTEDSPVVKEGDIICRLKEPVIENMHVETIGCDYKVRRIEDGKIYVVSFTNDMRLDPYQGKEHLWEGKCWKVGLTVEGEAHVEEMVQGMWNTIISIEEMFMK